MIKRNKAELAVVLLAGLFLVALLVSAGLSGGSDVVRGVGQDSSGPGDFVSSAPDSRAAGGRGLHRGVGHVRGVPAAPTLLAPIPARSYGGAAAGAGALVPIITLEPEPDPTPAAVSTPAAGFSFPRQSFPPQPGGGGGAAFLAGLLIGGGITACIILCGDEIVEGVSTDMPGGIDGGGGGTHPIPEPSAAALFLAGVMVCWGTLRISR